MLNAKEIKSRIKGIKDTEKITNAMYMIASSKMRKAKNDLDKTRPYFAALHKEIKRVFRTVEGVENRYFYPADGSEAPDGTYGILVITTDKGLAGSYNKSVIKETQRLISEHPDSRLFVVGEYGRRFFKKHNYPIEEDFIYSNQHITMDMAREISYYLLDLFDNGELDKIFVVYSDLKNSLTTKALSNRLIPFHRTNSIPHTIKDEPEVSAPFEFHPSVEAVVDSVVRIWMSGFIYSALIDSFCSEQSARMTAMSMANKNAEKIIHYLTIQYNMLRQETITEEITEVISGAKAQKQKQSKEMLQP